MARERFDSKMSRDGSESGQLGPDELRAVLESMADGLLLVDGRTIVRYANPAAQALLARSPTDLIGSKLVVPPVVGGEIYVDVPDRETTRVCELRASHLVGWERERLLVVSVRDVTGRERARRDAQAASEAKSGFLNLIVHEVRAPLGVIASALSLLSEDVVESNPARRRFLLETAANKAKDLVQLVEATLTWARLEAGGVKPNRQPVDVRDVATAATERARGRASLDGGQIALSVPAERAMVEIVPGQIGLVLDNLINNALAYSDRKPRVEVRLDRHESDVEISVIDHGIGIPREQQRAIFEPYRRGSSERVARQPGTGLGLSIARGLTQLNGGGLELAESQPGRGSRFVVRLPLARSGA